MNRFSSWGRSRIGMENRITLGTSSIGKRVRRVKYVEVLT
jgi:hypothetical protein